MTNTTTDAAEVRALLEAMQKDRSTEHGRAAFRLLRRLGGGTDHGPYSERDDWTTVFLATAEAASGAGEREVFPKRIGQLSLGERLSDGEDRQCAGGCDQPIPAGHAIYWPERIGEYPDDIDPSCISCAIAKAESEQGWCECQALASRPPATDPAKPTSEMLDAAEREGWDRAAAEEIWLAMSLAAAPTIPATGEAMAVADAAMVDGETIIGWLKAEQDRLDAEGSDYLMDTTDCINVVRERSAALAATIPATGHAATEGEGA